MNMGYLIEQVGKIEFTEMDFDEALDQREQPEFDEMWMRVYDEVEALKEGNGYSKEQESYASQIREKVYLNVYHITKDDDFAAYISDDFGLICDAEYLAYHNAWLQRLIKCYTDATFPCGKL